MLTIAMYLKTLNNPLLPVRLSSYGQYVIMLTTMFVTLVKVSAVTLMTLNYDF